MGKKKAEQAIVILDKNKQLFYEAMLLNMGVVTNASIACGISRTSHYNWMQEDKHYKAIIDDIDEQLLDMSENVVLTSIKGGSLKAATFHLTKKGSSRGYGNKMELTGDIRIGAIQVVKPE